MSLVLRVTQDCRYHWISGVDPGRNSWADNKSGTGIYK